ncbi:glycosyltransferase family 2 protein [Croceimicrobium sp.]|uniref:glycosyltransferase family 2 protein n=1 Tax=Croceimicrobium sp. TaxID=2828340 RepID=UPI003BAA494B
MPKLTIIVPNYQHEAYLAQRLESIKNQSFQDYEVILLDDASKDGSAGILQAYADANPEWQLILNDQNSGSPFKQWNKGVALAQGEYIWVAESDDLAHPDLLAALVPLLDENPQVGIAYAQSMLIDEAGHELNSYEENLRFLYKSKAWQEDFIINGKEACRNWLFFHNPIPNASGALFRKSAYLEAGGGDPQMRLNGDWYLYAKILLHYDLAFKAEILNYFRVHTQTQRSRSRKQASVYKELIAINQLLREGIPDANKEADAAMDEFANWWIGNLPYHSLNSENRALNKVHFRIFGEYKNNLVWRIFITYVISYLRDFLKWIGLLKPLKKLRSQIFPGKYWNS